MTVVETASGAARRVLNGGRPACPYRIAGPAHWRICDVRLRPEQRGGVLFPGALKAALEYVGNWYDVEVFRTAVFGEDFRGLWPWLRRDEQRYEQPMAQVMSRMDAVWLPIHLRRLPRPSRHVQRATEIDRDELIAFLLKKGHPSHGGEPDVGPALKALRDLAHLWCRELSVGSRCERADRGVRSAWDAQALRSFRLGRAGRGPLEAVPVQLASVCLAWRRSRESLPRWHPWS